MSKSSKPTENLQGRPSKKTGVNPLAGKRTWIFDLDNTLYDADSHVFKQIDLKMGGFISKLLGLSYDEARILQKTYLRDHGTTLKGLMDNHNIDPKDFLEFVHDVDVSPIQFDQMLKDSILALEGPKFVFTNGDITHAERILSRLKMENSFDGIFDIANANYIPKPQQAPYDAMVNHFSINPKEAVMVEDMARNLTPAHHMGMATIWLNTGTNWGALGHIPDHITHEILDLPKWLDAFIKDQK